MYAPALNDLLYAGRGQGAFANGQQVRVSEVADLREAMLIHGGLKDLKVRPCWQPFLRLVDVTGRQRGFGDALGHSLVIRGQAEVALEPEIKSGRTLLRLCRHSLYLQRQRGGLERPDTQCGYQHIAREIRAKQAPAGSEET